MSPAANNAAAAAFRVAHEEISQVVRAAGAAVYAVEDKTHEKAAQKNLLHCIFANPFDCSRFDVSWLTPTVLNLATAIYKDRTLGGLPILADALEEVGCDNSDLLVHFRSAGPHALGCWALDVVLGKE
jgi:hypothetical protein